MQMRDWFICVTRRLMGIQKQTPRPMWPLKILKTPSSLQIFCQCVITSSRVIKIFHFNRFSISDGPILDDFSHAVFRHGRPPLFRLRAESQSSGRVAIISFELWQIYGPWYPFCLLSIWLTAKAVKYLGEDLFPLHFCCSYCVSYEVVFTGQSGVLVCAG